MQSLSEHTQHAQKTAVCARVEIAELQSKRLLSNKAFGWNKGYFVTNVVAVEHAIVCLICRNCEYAVLGLHGMLGVFKLCCKFYCC